VRCPPLQLQSAQRSTLVLLSMVSVTLCRSTSFMLCAHCYTVALVQHTHCRLTVLCRCQYAVHHCPLCQFPARHFPLPVRQIPVLHFQSVTVLSCNFYPCDLVRHFSSSAVSTPAMLSVHFQSCNVQSCKFSYPNRRGDWNFQDWKITG